MPPQHQSQSMQVSKFPWVHTLRSPIALACFVQRNKHKDLLHRTMAGYVAVSTENKFDPSL